MLINDFFSYYISQRPILPYKNVKSLTNFFVEIPFPPQSAALRAKDANGFQKGILAMTLSSRQVTVTKTANEWLFKGYKDPLVTIGGFVAKFVKEVEVPYDRIGWLYTVGQNTRSTP